MSYTAMEWMQLCALGTAFGALGQAVRTIPGLKKLSDESGNIGGAFRESFSASRLIVSLIIGGVAGVLAVMSLGLKLNEPIDTTSIFALLAAGYSGADFIEAFMTSHKLPNVAPVVNKAAEGPASDTAGQGGSVARPVVPVPKAVG